MAKGKTSTSFSKRDSARAKAAQAQRPIKGALRSPDLRALRGQQIVQMRLTNMPIADIARVLNISTDTVEADLAWMRETGRIQKLEDQVLDLVPSALKVAKETLESSDPKRVTAAIKVLEMLLRLGDRQEARSARTQERVDNLQDYVTRLQLQSALKAAESAEADSAIDVTPERTE